MSEQKDEKEIIEYDTAAATANDNDDHLDIESHLKTAHTENKNKRSTNTMSVNAYYQLCKTDKMAYASPQQRLVKAIGDPKVVDTNEDERLREIYGSQEIERYEAFSEFYGMEKHVSEIVSYIRQAAEGGRPARQMLLLMGPVGSGKSSVVARLVELLGEEDMYVLQFQPVDEDGNPEGEPEISPLQDSPISLLQFMGERGKDVGKSLGLDKVRQNIPASPWLMEKYKEANGDIGRFTVARVTPSLSKRIAYGRHQAKKGTDQSTQDLLGRTDVSKVHLAAQSESKTFDWNAPIPDSNQGILEMIETLKNNDDILLPFLTALPERKVSDSTVKGDIPFDVLAIGHTNQSEYDNFMAVPEHEALKDRFIIIDWPYTLQPSQEQKIYLKEDIRDPAEVAPHTLDLLAQFAVATRIKPPLTADPRNPQNAALDMRPESLLTKTRVYNGEKLEGDVSGAKSIDEYRREARMVAPEKGKEGMWGMSTRRSGTLLSEVFDKNARYNKERVADPVMLFQVMEEWIHDPQKSQWLGIDPGMAMGLKDELENRYEKVIKERFAEAVEENFDEKGQEEFDRYVTLLEHFMDGRAYKKDGHVFDRQAIDGILRSYEEPAGIISAKDHRVNFERTVLKAQAKNGGKNPDWKDVPEFRTIIRKKLLKYADDKLLMLVDDSESGATKNKTESIFQQNLSGEMSPKTAKRALRWLQGRNLKSTLG